MFRPLLAIFRCGYSKSLKQIKNYKPARKFLHCIKDLQVWTQ
jgi:hypothetical protein